MNKEIKKQDLAIEKYNLIKSPEYQKIRAFQLNDIVSLAGKGTDPNILTGMLLGISNTDKWEKDFINLKSKKENEEKRSKNL